MTYVIGQPCIDVLDRSCVDECPVDCIYEGGRMLYIHPDECVDCGACEPVCPVEAIYYEDDLPDQWQIYTADNARFFAEPLPGRSEPLGSPGGAQRLGPVGVDTDLVADHPRSPVSAPDIP
jgi:NAD-dependent dihydropyrimidine dehydrogenase PreA subunit